MLVVEDERSLCNAITKGLRLDGYEVDSCLDGNEAWDMILAERYDLIILDLNLPGMDGMEILRSFRKENVETNVLILSARSQLQDKMEGLDSGANDYLCKPFHFEELEARVRSLMRRRVIQSKCLITTRLYKSSRICENISMLKNCNGVFEQTQTRRDRDGRCISTAVRVPASAMGTGG